MPRGISYSSELPDCGDESPLGTLLVGLKEITQDNFLSAVSVLGKNSKAFEDIQSLECTVQPRLSEPLWPAPQSKCSDKQKSLDNRVYIRCMVNHAHSLKLQ